MSPWASWFCSLICKSLIMFTASINKEAVGNEKLASFMYFEYKESSSPKFLINGKTTSLTCDKILSEGYSLHSDHLQFLCPSKIDLNLIPFNVAFCCSKTSLSSIFFIKIKYDICSIACNGLLMPPLQNLSHNFLIFDFSSACSMV